MSFLPALLLALPAFCAEPPAWTKAPSDIPMDGSVRVVGIGTSMDAAVANALGQAAANLQSYEVAIAKEKTPKGRENPQTSEREQKVSDTMKQFSKQAFGPINVTRLIVDKHTSGGKDFTGAVEETLQISYEKGAKKYRIRSNMSSETLSSKSSREQVMVQIDAEGLGLLDLLKELSTQGFSFQEWRDPADYMQFVGLERAAPKKSAGK